MIDLSLLKYTGMAILGFVAAILLLLGYAEWNQTRAWLASANQTIGTVVTLEEHTEMHRFEGSPTKDRVRPSTTVLLTIEFPYQDQVYHIEESSYVFRWFYSVGDEVTVVFDPEAPEVGHLDHALVIWGPTAALLLLGLCFAAGTLLIFRLMP